MSDSLELKNRHTGETLRLRRVTSNGETTLVIEGTLPSKSAGPPPHILPSQEESGVVIAGVLAARVGDKEVTIQAGENAVFPAGVVHSWWNGGDVLLEFNGQAKPAGDLDRFLQGIFAVVNSSDGRPPLFYLAHVLWRHRKSQRIVVPPPAVQNILFPIVIGIGKVLGKYRGSDWPGSPQSCTGAPTSN